MGDGEAIDEKSKGDDYFRHSEYRRAAARLAFETEKFKLEEILEDARRALEINPQWYKAKFREGVTLNKLHRHEEAIWSLEEGQRLNPTQHQGWENEIQVIKADRVTWNNRKKLSYLNDVE